MKGAKTVDIAEMARKCDIHRITPLTPAMLNALTQFAGMCGGSERCIKIVEDMAEDCASRPMKSILLQAAEEMKR
jgi:hypothetical protein